MIAIGSRSRLATSSNQAARSRATSRLGPDVASRARASSELRPPPPPPVVSVWPMLPPIGPRLEERRAGDRRGIRGRLTPPIIRAGVGDRRFSARPTRDALHPHDEDDPKEWSLHGAA